MVNSAIMAFGKRLKIHGYCLAALLVSAMVGLLDGQAAVRPRTTPASPLTIVNGTDAFIREGEDGFVYCYADPGGGRRRRRSPQPYRVLWTDPQGLPLPSYGQRSSRVFAFRESYPVPHSYLVFRHFDDASAGVYACSLLRGGRVLARRSIYLRLFRPSFRVVRLPPCLAVPEGGTLLLPSPVTGSPPKPPLWTKVGGRMDPSTTLLLNGGLLLHGVQDGGVYRAVVKLGAGLVHQQEVSVSVLLPDGEVVGGSPEDEDFSCSLSYSTSGVAMANELIADVQIHSYRRRVSEARRKGR